MRSLIASIFVAGALISTTVPSDAGPMSPAIRKIVAVYYPVATDYLYKEVWKVVGISGGVSWVVCYVHYIGDPGHCSPIPLK